MTKFSDVLKVIYQTIQNIPSTAEQCNLSELITDEIIFAYEFDDLLFTANYLTVANSNLKILIDRDLYFHNCSFKKIKFNSYKNDNDEAKNITFVNCLNPENISLSMRDSEFAGDFLFYDSMEINHEEQLYIQRVQIDKCIFNGNFKISNLTINQEFSIDNSVFEKSADFSHLQCLGDCPIDTILVLRSKFSNLVLFEECIFNKKLALDYSTFSGLAQFRNSIFREGLDLEKTNIEKEMNFYGVVGLGSPASKRETSQETYRIIKNQFEKQNNKLDANIFHSYELEKRMINLEKEKLSFANYFEYVILFYNFAVSRFSTNIFSVILSIITINMFLSILMIRDNIVSIVIFLAVVLIAPFLLMQLYKLERIKHTRYDKISESVIIFGIIYMFAQNIFKQNIKYHEFGIWNFIPDIFLINLNLFGTPQAYIDYFKNNGLSNILNNNCELSIAGMVTYFLTKTIIGFLYYQFITTARKDTRK